MPVLTATHPLPTEASPSLRRLWRFHAPLAGHAVLLTMSGPLLGIMVGRGAEPRLELAAFWLAITVALFAQSLCLALQQATVALVRARVPLRALVLSAVGAGVLAALTVLAIAVTPLGEWVFTRLIPATPRTGALACQVLRVLAPLPLLIALRSVASGVAVGGQRTSLVALTTVTRLLVLTILLTVVVASGIVAGAMAAAWAMVLGIAAETTFILWSTRRAWTPELGRVESDGMRQAYGDVLRVAAPLAIAALGWTATRPLVHAILGRLEDPERAQAGFGVLLPWLLLAGAPVWALLETTLVLARTSDDEARLRRFAMLLATGVAVVIAVLVSPPVRDFWITVALGRDPGLLMAIESALPWLVLAPLLVAGRAVAQGLLMRERQTTALLYLSPIRFVLVGCVGFLITVWFPRTDGPAFALLLILGGDALDALTYSLAARRACVRGAQARQACSGSEPIPLAEHEPQRRIA